MVAWALICVTLAAVCNAVMDRVETRIAFDFSIFYRRNPRFWCKPVSAHNARFLPGTRWRDDAWHRAKSGMIILLFSAMSLCLVHIGTWLEAGLLFTGGGLWWNYVFSMFYHRLLIK